ncbi:MAG TPA: R.Pab1 family restriction endonuclease [Candidatus Aenigmarchaeota archaeon]|nr:R.Pab1 family restriction endonuclease [Candidatus Aenigmarchaeota archaeon]
MVESEVKWEDGKIVCELPITLPTSKIRVKRDDEPIAVRQNNLKEDDLLEWQISYYKEGKILIEVGKMLELAYQHGIVTKEELEKLGDYVDKVQKLFDEDFEITKEETDKKFLGEFKILFRHVPIIHKELDNGCFIEAELKHKQRAVGYQPMLYIFIPVKNVVADDSLGSLIGRPAESREIAKWFPTKNDILGTIKTFAVLSQKHRDDIVEIIKRMLKS